MTDKKDNDLTENKDSDIIPNNNSVDGVNNNHNTDKTSTENNKNTEHPGMKNLIPFNQLTEEEHRAIARKAGVESGKKRREKKHMREIAQTLLAQKMDKDQIDEILGTAQDLLDGDMTVAAVLTARIMQEAAQGNTKAYEVLRDTAGYKPTEQLEVGTIDPGTAALLDKIATRTGISVVNK